MNFKNLVNGAIFGKAKLTDVVHYKNDEDFNRDKDLHLASKGWGDYGFILEDAERIKPIITKGNLGFWGFQKESLIKKK